MKQTHTIYRFPHLLIFSTLLLACDGGVFSGASKEGSYWCQSSNKLFRDNFCGKEGDCPNGWTYFDLPKSDIRDFPDPEVCCEDPSNGNQFFFAGEKCPSQWTSVSGSCALDETQDCHRKILEDLGVNPDSPVFSF